MSPFAVSLRAKSVGMDNTPYFELSLCFVLFFHSSWLMILLSSRISTNDESMMSSISTSSLKSSVALFCLRRSFLTLSFIPPGCSSSI